MRHEPLEQRQLLAVDASPFVVSINRSIPANAVADVTAVSFDITFSEAVTGVDSTDFQVAKNGTISATLGSVNPSGDGIHYSVAVTGISGNGEVGLNLVDNGTIRDATGHLLTVSTPSASFQARQTFAANGSPAAVKFGDFNGDGKADMAVSNTGTNTASIFLGNGNGTFQSPSTVGTGSSSFSMTVGDVNGDGKTDIVVSNYASSAASLLISNGDGTFQTRQTFAAGNGAREPLLADVNGDQALDLIVTNFNGSNASLMLGNGNGTFQPQQTIACGPTPQSVVAGDVNGDGKQDLMFANQTSNTASTLLGNGDGTFQARTTVPTDTGLKSAVLGDINNDGKSDIVITNNGTNTMGVYLSNGDGTFQSQQHLTVGAQPSSGQVGDFNGDGLLDVVCNNNGAGTFSVLIGKGDGTFQTQQTYTSGSAPVGLVVGDVNNDGRSDLAITNYSSNATSLLINAIKGDYVGQVYSINQVAPFVVSINRENPVSSTAGVNQVSFAVTFSETVTGVDAADFQLVKTGSIAATMGAITPAGDGIHYSVAVTSITGAGTLGLNLVDNGTVRDTANNPLTNQGATASFQSQRTFGANGGPAPVAFADFNGDGKLDLALVNTSTNTASILLGNGDGTFQAQQSFATGPNSFSVDAGDLNGDGKPDLIVANYNSSNQVSLLLGNGDGTFQTRQTLTAGGRPRMAILGDVNADQKLDILVANFSSSNASVLLSNGNGTFQPQQTYATGATPQSIAIGDANGDGKVDLAFANQTSNTASVLLGNGDGTFQARQTVATDSGLKSAVLGDVNNDGNGDLILTNNGTSTVGIFVSNGNGTFQAQQHVTVGAQPSSMITGDFNGDGNLDLAYDNNGNGTMGVLIGNGNGTFLTQQTFAVGSAPVSIALGDVNGDGRADLAVANISGNTVSVMVNAVKGDFTGQTYALTLPQVTLSLNGNSLAENGGAATVTASLSFTSSQDVTVDLTFSGTASNGVDYSASSASIVITAGQTSGTVVLSALDDIAYEGNETVIVDINSVTNGSENGTQQVSATITDDDPALSVALSLAGSPMAENGGVATVIVTLSNPSTQNVTVDLAFGGTATLASDYTISGMQVVVNAGDISGSITLTGLNDMTHEGDETIVIDISGVTNGVENGVQQVTATITDDATDPFQWSGSTLTISGTAGADVFALQQLPGNTGSVSLNGIPLYFNNSQVSQINYNGFGGGDVVYAIVNIGLSEVLSFTPGGVTVATSSYSFTASGATQVIAYGDSADSQTFSGSSGDDVFYGYTNASIIAMNSSSAVSVGIMQTTVQSSAGQDAAVLVGSFGDDTLTARPNQTTFIGPGFSQTLSGWAHIYAFGIAGNDSAQLFDDNTNDEFHALSPFSVLLGPRPTGWATFLLEPIGFATVRATASSGGTDLAVLYDTSNSETFSGNDTLSSLSNSSFRVEAELFDYVYGLATLGGTDTATIDGSTGNDYLFASGPLAQYYSYGNGAFIQLYYFDTVTAKSNGGSDGLHRTDPVDYALALEGTWVNV